MMAQLYNHIKQADPYHLISGATNCQGSFFFQDVPSAVPSGLHSKSKPTMRLNEQLPGAWIQADTQPKLQLSLDMVIPEQYNVSLRDKGIFGGGWEVEKWKAGGFNAGMFQVRNPGPQPLQQIPPFNTSRNRLPVPARAVRD